MGREEACSSWKAVNLCSIHQGKMQDKKGVLDFLGNGDLIGHISVYNLDPKFKLDLVSTSCYTPHQPLMVISQRAVRHAGTSIHLHRTCKRQNEQKYEPMHGFEPWILSYHLWKGLRVTRLTSRPHGLISAKLSFMRIINGPWHAFSKAG